MAFPKGLLADNEKMVLDLRPHWLSVVPPALWTLLFAGLWFASYLLTKEVMDPGDARNNVQMVLHVLFLTLVFYFGLMPILRWRFTHFVLTSDRLITRRGVISKHSREIPLERINDVTFTQTVLERVVGAGDLLIESAGQQGQNRITNVRKPEQVQLEIYKMTEDNSTRMMGGGSQRALEESIPGQIEVLARLRKEGVLTEEEFQAKKKDLLDRL